MSKKTEFQDALVSAGQRAGGSFKTQSDRGYDLLAFVDACWEQGYQLTQVDSIRIKHVAEYVAARLEEGISSRTLHNELASLRAMFREAGRAAFADSKEFSNRALGVPEASRHGTKVAISDEAYRGAYERALARDPGVAACLALERYLGLRGEEAVQVGQSLAMWVKALATSKDSVKVVFGTKGGRPRETHIISAQAKEAVRFAKAVADQRGGKLIEGANLKAAMQRYGNEVRAIGLVGVNSPHSLRYAFAQDAMRHYLEQGHCRAEARALVSCDLGHGDGRGRYVASVYALSE